MTPLERSDLHAAIETRYPDNTTEDITPLRLRDGLHDLVDSLFVKATDQYPMGAVYLRLRSGKTLFHLGKGVRDKTKLWLRKFGIGTLPAILPEPVLDPDRPAVAAPGSAFQLSAFIGGPATGPAAIAEYTRQVSDGDHFLLTGADLDQAAYPVYQNGNFYATTVTAGDRQKAAVRLPRVGAAWDAALAWPSTAAGIGVPVLLNVARVKWEQDVWAPGLEISIFGENLAHGNVEGGAGYVAIQQSGGPVTVYDTRAANAYRTPFQVPRSVVPGPLDYWYHNGHGGDYGWSQKRTVTVVATEDHVRTHDFGQPSQYLILHPTDGAINVGILRDTYRTLWQQGGGTFSTDAGTFPINDTIQPRDGVRWVCSTAASGGVTSLVATAWVGTSNLGMFGSNYWVKGEVDGVEFRKPANVQLANSEAVIVLNNLDQVHLRRVRARWNAPYAERQAGPVKEAVPAQPMRLSTSKNVFLDEVANTGSGMHLGSNSQVFLTNYTHRATHNADHMVYSLNMLGWCMIGYDLRDLDPTSTDGVDRGIRCIKSGGQGGRNRYRHLEKGVGTALGIVRSGTNQAPDDNQFEQDLDELNKTVYTDKVLRATATTVTVPRTLIVQVNNQPVSILQPTEHLVAIVAGRGEGQWRGIVSTTADTITVDEPWRVQPDATSVLHTGWFNCDSTRYDVHYTGKSDNAKNPLYNHSSWYNGFGGVRGGIIDKCSGEGFRQGISYVATQHAADKVDQTAFNVVRNSQFPNCRWGRRFEAVPGQAGWSFDVPGLLANLFSNCSYNNAILSEEVYQLPRTTAGAVPNIDLLVQENQQQVVVGLNDYTPSFVDDPLYPPIALLAGTVAASPQLVQQAQVALSAPGTLLVAAGEIGPLEPLPAGAAIDPANGVLSYLGTDPAVLVYVDGAQEIPLDRTPVASGSTATPTPGGSVIYTAGAGIDITGGVISAIPAAYPVVATVAGVETGFATLELAIAANPAAIYLHADVQVSAVTPRFAAGTLFGNGHAITLATGGQLRLGRQVCLYNGLLADGGGTVVVTGNGVPAGGTVPIPAECVQLFDFTLEAPLTFGAASAYQGLALRGNSVVSNLASGGGPVYLYDLAEAPGPLPVGFTVYDRRPGAAGGGAAYSAGTGIDLSGNQFSSTRLEVAAAQTGNYTVQLADAGKLVPVSAASAVTITVPDHASVPFPIGTTLYVAQDGTGAVTIVGASGVLVQTAEGYHVPGQWTDVALHKRDLNTWVLKGGVS